MDTLTFKRKDTYTRPAHRSKEKTDKWHVLEEAGSVHSDRAAKEEWQFNSYA